MSVKNPEMKEFQKRLKKLQKDVPKIMDELVVGEGIHARDEARKICKSEHIVNTGDYRRNFNCSSKALRRGNTYKIDVFNNLDYAKHLEYGFRSHFVPGHWEGKTFKYQPNDPQGGMYVGEPGGYVKGHYTLKRAVSGTQQTQRARLERKSGEIFRRYMSGGGEEK